MTLTWTVAHLVMCEIKCLIKGIRGSEDVGIQKVQECVQLMQIVLHWSACQQQNMLVPACIRGKMRLSICRTFAFLTDCRPAACDVMMNAADNLCTPVSADVCQRRCLLP